MKQRKYSLRMRTYYMLIVFVIVLFSFAAVAGALFLLQRFGYIHRLNYSALLGLLAILAILTGLAGKRVAVVLLRLRGRIERIAVALRLRVIGVVGIAVALLAL